MQKLNGREIYSGIVLLLIANIVLVFQGIELMSDYSDAFRTTGNTIQIASNDLKDILHNLVIIVLGFSGAFLLFKKKSAGWVISFSLLLFFTVLAVYFLVSAFSLYGTGTEMIVIALLALIPLLGLIFLLIPSTIKKYRVGIKAILPTLLLFMALVSVTLFL